ncbi:hypothetical protein CRE_21983 [Caenorhabditis remanei]|uniref:F-box domain-containing protein n=1 Tax=Caenorhabditis remanei TaxID=31234 RepID=E3N3F2_CAERE|nr:hypothetical protein CRE_21983 [Caenorhabditis remanei]
MSPFPLLRLPRLVLREVFKLLSISGKIKLSFCSKKVFALINNDRLYSPEVIVGLDILYQNIEVYSGNDEDSFKVLTCCEREMSSASDIQQYRIEGRTVRVTSSSTRIKTFWKNYSEGFLSVIRFILKIFRCKISTGFNCHFSDLPVGSRRLTATKPPSQHHPSSESSFLLAVTSSGFSDRMAAAREEIVELLYQLP